MIPLHLQGLMMRSASLQEQGLDAFPWIIGGLTLL